MFFVNLFLFEKKREVHTPMDLDYMRKIRFRLRLMDSWPNKELNQPHRPWPLRHHNFLGTLWFSTWIAQILYIRNNAGRLSFFELGHNYITAIMTAVNVHRVLSLMLNKDYLELGREFVNEMHLFHHRNMSEYAMKTYNQVHKICTFFTNYIHVQMVLGIILFNMSPMMHNYTSGMYSLHPPANGTYMHCVYYELPFDYTTNVMGYLTIFFLNCVLTYDAGAAMCVYNSYIFLIVFHSWGHLKILDYHLRHFPRPAMEGKVDKIESNPVWYNEEESKEVTTMLKNNINHHRLIMNFVDRSSKAFGSVLCAFFSFEQVCGCILLLECSKMDKAALMEYGLLTFIMFQQLVQISIVFEFLGSKSETLKDSVYYVPWEYMDTSNRKIVLFFLNKVQTPIALKAAGLVPVGVQTMAAILKTSVSYFVMLRTMSE